MAGHSRREIAIVLAGRIALAAVSLVYLKLVLSMLGPADFGIYTFVFSTATSLSMLIFTAGNIPTTRISAANPDNALIGPGIISLATYSGLPAAVACALAAFAVFAASDDLSLPEAAQMAVAAGVLGTGVGVMGLFSSFVLGQRRHITNMAFNNGMLLSRIAAVVLLAALVVPTATSVIWAVALGGAVLAALAALTVDRNRRLLPLSTMRETMLSVGLFKQYCQNWLAAVGSNLFVHGDKMVLAFVLPIEMIGLLTIYQQLSRMLANLTIGTIYQYASPFLLSRSERSRASAVGALKTSIFSIAVFMVVTLAVSMMLWAVNDYFLENEHTLEMGAFLLISLGTACAHAGHINELNYFSSDRVDLLIWPVLASVVIFATICLWLAATYGLIGAILGLTLATVGRFAMALVIVFRGAR